jgi:hypothetical protein
MLQVTVRSQSPPVQLQEHSFSFFLGTTCFVVTVVRCNEDGVTSVNNNAMSKPLQLKTGLPQTADNAQACIASNDVTLLLSL